MYQQNKQENGGGAPVASLVPKSGLEIYREKSIYIFHQEYLTFYGVTPSLFSEEGRCPLYMGSRRFSRVMTCSSLYIAKLPLSSVFDRHQEGYMCDSWVVICLS